MRIRMTVMAALATLAGSAGLYPLFSRGTWFWSVLGAVLVTAAGGLLVRRFRAPAILSLVGGLAFLHLFLTVRFAAGQAWLGFVPTPGSLERLGDLYGAGWDAANRYAAPVPMVPGITMLTATGVGLVAAVVDLLAVRTRRAAPAGLPLLAMYSVPAAVREESIGWAAFGIGAAGYLMLLVADSREHVGAWGRVVLARRRTDEAPAGRGRIRPDSRGLAVSGRRIGFAAVALAVLVPTIVPGIHPRGPFGLGGDSGGGGTQTVTTPDPLVSLKRELTRADDSVVLTYSTTDQTPGYLRLYALDRYDGDRWTYSPLESTARDRVSGDDLLPPPRGLTRADSRRVRTSVQVREEVSDMTFLPVPYAPSRLSIDGRWRVDAESLMIYSLRDSAGGRAYEVTSIEAAPTPKQLAADGSYPDDILAPYTAVSRDVPAKVRQLAREVTAGADSAHAQAVRLQKWFTADGGFQYDLSAPAPDRGDDLADFLLRSRRGYCEQYAAAMALMARILGVPARVAMGYTPGTQVTPGQWVVRSRDAHAWPELYFPGTGWVRFEPTPAGAAGQGTATLPPYTEPASIGAGLEQEEDATPGEAGAGGEGASAGPPASESARPQDQDPAEAVPEPETGEGSGLPTGWLAGGLLVLLILAAPVTVRLLARRRRWATAVPHPQPGTQRPGGAAGDPGGAAHAAWREMHADALDHGLTWHAADTPRAAAQRLGELLELDEESSGALGRIARAEELARYARSHPGPPPDALKADVRTVREAFAAAVSRRARLQARYLPPSGLAVLRDRVGGQAMDSAGRLEALRRRLATLLHPRRR